MNILVTGVAGFIGSNLADRLIKEGHRVIGIDNLSYGIREQIPNKVKFHEIDIRSKEIYPMFKNVDYVFHLAAKSCIPDCQLDPIGTSDINITGTVNVFEASKEANVKKVIYAESSSVYEESKIFPTPETELCPGSFYSISKLAGMYFAEAYENLSNLKFTALRYFCVYGSRQDYRRVVPPVISAFIIKLLKGQSPIVYGDGEKRRDFIHVDDVNDFHVRCIQNSRTDGRTFNIGSGTNHSIFDIYNLIANLLDIHIPFECLPDLQKGAFTTLADIREAKKLGWIPKVDFCNGLKEMIEYIKNEFKQGNIG